MPKIPKKAKEISKIESKETTKSKAVAKKSTTKKTSVQKTSTKKATTNSKSTKKAVSSKKAPVNKKATSRKTVKSEILEYYDLPYRYNQTIVRILAQTPNTLFVYWDISDEDKKSYIKTYGENFFNTTKPILIIHNKTKNYSFEIEISDFANSWYFNVNDANCNYEIELGRKPKLNMGSTLTNYLYISSSNIIEAPNNHMLLDESQKVVYFKNTKTYNTYSKDISTLNFIKRIGKIYNIYDIYKKIYKDENLNNLEHPSSY